MGRPVRRKVVRVRFCSVRGCPNYGRSFRKSANLHTISIFNCPTPNSPMLKKWLQALKMPEYDSRIHICIRHFEEDFIIREKTIVNHDGSTSVVPLRKPVVTKNAVPTIFDEMTTKLEPHCPLVRMWRGAPRKYADTSIQAICSVSLQTEPREGAGDSDREVAYDEINLVKTPIFIKSEVPDPELDWLNEDTENCKTQNTIVKQDINVENDVIIKQEIDIDDERHILVENEAVVNSCKRKRKRIRGAPVGPQVKKPRGKELFYPCPICHSLIQRRRQMINHMQRRHPDDELTKRVLKEREVNPRGHYRSLSPYLSLAIKAPDGFYDYPSKDEDVSHRPPASDSSHPPSPSLSPTPSDCEDPLAVQPASTEPSRSPPVSICAQSPKSPACILPEPYLDDAPSASPVPSMSDTSTTHINIQPSSAVSEPCDSKSKCHFPLPSLPPLVPIHVPSYSTSSVKKKNKKKQTNVTSKPCSCVGSSISDSVQNANIASPPSDDIPPPLPSSDQEDAAISSSVIFSSWDLSVFKVHLYNIPKKKKDFLKKRLLEVVEAVTVRNLDPESIIIAYCDRSIIKS